MYCRKADTLMLFLCGFCLWSLWFGRALVGRCLCSIRCINTLSQIPTCFLPKALVLTVICKISVDTSSCACPLEKKCQLNRWEQNKHGCEADYFCHCENVTITLTVFYFDSLRSELVQRYLGNWWKDKWLICGLKGCLNGFPPASSTAWRLIA